MVAAIVVAVSGASSPIDPARSAAAAPSAALLIPPGGAEALSTAERIVPIPTGLRFPMDPLPRCVVGNNFGAMSKLYGAGAHEGVDISGTLGQRVFAVEDGVLSRQFANTSAAGFGWELVPAVGNVRYRYYHLSGFADGLAAGARVVAGQLIGYVGDTGNPGAGNYHLHFEVRPGNVPVDPVPLLGIPSTCQVLPRA
ncbi:MAG TPA: M23 family metallopeptidase [Ilumatobacteraceae bacterium]|nr:M23 family metallopeptidase [Ilumatobacteraceae bacterium]